MKDLNFFESYIEKRKFKLDFATALRIIGVVVLFVLIGKLTYNGVVISMKKKQIRELRDYAEDEVRLARVEKIKAKEYEMEEFSKSLDRLKTLNEMIEEKYIIDERILNVITTSMPEEAFLTSFDMDNYGIDLFGIAKDKWSVAELSRALERLDEYENIFIADISAEDDFYNFSIHIDLGGEEDGSTNEESESDGESTEEGDEGESTDDN